MNTYQSVRALATAQASRSSHLGLRLALIACGVVLLAATVRAADWPQWRGTGRDAKATGFKAPATWPKELVRKWQVTVGRGDATPALVGGKLYVFVRDETSEIAMCLNAADGKEIWRQKYEAAAAKEPMGRHPGPRSSPAVAGGKMVTYGVRGALSCFDTTNGKLLWQKDDFAGAWPRFFTSSSPLLVDGMCIAQLGSEQKGGIVAYDLANGEQKWKWTDDGTAYASPALLTAGDTNMVVTLTANKIVGLNAADGKCFWESSFPPQRRAYNAATPIIDGQTVYYSGAARGTKALKIEKTGQGFAAKELWSTEEQAVQFNTPVLKDARLYGLSQRGNLFCLEAASGKTLWSAALGGKGFGSIVDAGPVLLALTPEGQLTVFAPGDKELKKLASYTVGVEIYAYPVLGDSKIYIKDKDSLACWAVE